MSAQRGHVSFQEGYVYGSGKTGAAHKPESSPSSIGGGGYRGYNATRFPNLQMMFKKQPVRGFPQEARKEQVAAVQPPAVAATATTAAAAAAAGRGDDVDSEADEFIKRNHENMELKKLLPLKSQTAAA
ncbi:hypothetical protein Cni_G21572 [Canna indica]|uniref:Uncharacterized protein n=1 Tax=Canna indica TaxID=4628 RepID=A0AAQ3KQ63_9LILI|nr:hypothetical protein Cni_G21572 [Canna indica]